MTYSYPPFPALPSSITGVGNFLLQLGIWFFSIPIITVANILISIGSGLGTSTGNTASTIVDYLGVAFAQSENSLAMFGAFAPIIASLIWGVSIIIIIFMVFKAVQVGLNEITNME